LERSPFGQGDRVAAGDDQEIKHSDVDERQRLPRAVCDESVRLAGVNEAGRGDETDCLVVPNERRSRRATAGGRAADGASRVALMATNCDTLAVSERTLDLSLREEALTGVVTERRGEA
jgi:hypothetical protein